MATILITLRYGFAARNVLRTGTLAGLRRAGHEVILVCRAAREPYLEAELGPEVVLEPYREPRSGFLESAFEAVTDAFLFHHPGTTETMTIKWWQLLTERRLLSWIGKGLAAILRLHRSGRLYRWVEQIDRRAFRHDEVADLLRRYRPDLVVTTELFGSESHYLREASRQGIPTVCLVKSWDNLTSKGRIRVYPDHMVVWSELMREEAVRLHFVPLERIFVSGSPNFDIFKAGDYPWMPRAEFMRSIGADPLRRLVVYSPGGRHTVSDEDNIRRIHRLLHAPGFPFLCHLHVRKYPKTEQDFSHLLALPHLTVEDAGIVVPSWADKADQPRAEMVHLAQVLYHTDVLIQIGTTLAVDAACFDRPVIGYFLDSQNQQLSPHHFARQFLNWTHNRYLVEVGGVWVVRTEEECETALRTYLASPELHREGRRRIVERISGIFDGRSGERVAEFLLRMLRERPPVEESAAPVASSAAR